MSVDQMLAHCNVMFTMAYDEHYPKPNGLMRFMLKNFVKPAVVGEKPYKRNTRTAPQFLIQDKKNFEKEKEGLLQNMDKTNELGPNYFDGREYVSFGKMNAQEWNNMFYKHLDHHLSQFGV